jgi:hypothetical protein
MKITDLYEVNKLCKERSELKWIAKTNGNTFIIRKRLFSGTTEIQLSSHIAIEMIQKRIREIDDCLKKLNVTINDE